MRGSKACEAPCEACEACEASEASQFRIRKKRIRKNNNNNNNKKKNNPQSLLIRSKEVQVIAYKRVLSMKYLLCWAQMFVKF